MNKRTQKKRIQIVIYVSGGIVQDVITDAAGVEAMIVDYDNEDAGEPKSSRLFEVVQVNRPYIAKTTKGIED